MHEQRRDAFCYFAAAIGFHGAHSIDIHVPKGGERNEAINVGRDSCERKTTCFFAANLSGILLKCLLFIIN